MSRMGVTILSISIIAVASFAVLSIRRNRPRNEALIEKISMQAIKLSSTAFENNSVMPSRLTCDGDNVSPPLEIAGVPKEARSLVLIMDDPDAPVGIWDHWVKFNVPPETKIIEEGKEPSGVSGKGTSGNLSYQGPCPPSGTHHYIFTVYALDTELLLPSGASKKEVERAMVGHVLGTGKLTGLYSRKS